MIIGNNGKVCKSCGKSLNEITDTFCNHIKGGYVCGNCANNKAPQKKAIMANKGEVLFIHMDKDGNIMNLTLNPKPLFPGDRVTPLLTFEINSIIGSNFIKEQL